MIAATALSRLSDVLPPSPNRVIKVRKEEPIPATLADGTAVLVTWIGEHSAVFARSSNPAEVYDTDKLVLKSQSEILVDPEQLTWVTERLMTKCGAWKGRIGVHKCVTCKRTAGQTRFATPHSEECLECAG